MRGAVLHAPGDVRIENRPDPEILSPTDAIIRLSATCICGSDLWPYRGIETVEGPAPMGHESMLQAIGATRPGGHISYVGVTHGELPGDQLFFSHAHLHGGPAPVRRFLPQLVELITDRAIDPGKVFDLTLPLDQVAEGYQAMDDRRAIKTLLTP